MQGDSRYVGYDPWKIFPLLTWSLKIQAARSYEMSLTIYESTCLHVTEDMKLQCFRNYPFQKRNYIQLKCINYTCLLESLFLAGFQAYSSSETQTLSVSETSIPLYDLCDYKFYDFMVRFKLELKFDCNVIFILLFVLHR
jgi:hypothetical protein